MERLDPDELRFLIDAAKIYDETGQPTAAAKAAWVTIAAYCARLNPVPAAKKSDAPDPGQAAAA